jgi:hypothetical protein
MNAVISYPSSNTYTYSQTNGVATRSIYKRRSPRRANLKEINHAYVDSQILQRPKTVKQSTPADVDYESGLFSEFEIDAYASNEELIRAFVSTNA